MGVKPVHSSALLVDCASWQVEGTIFYSNRFRARKSGCFQCERELFANGEEWLAFRILRIGAVDASKSSNYLNKLAKRKEVRLREITVSTGNI